MTKSLNPDQAKGLANFFFDTARGIVLGVLGLSAVTPGLPPTHRITNIAGGLTLAYFCIRSALSLLEK